MEIISVVCLFVSGCPDSRPEWMELGGGGGAVCYAPSRFGKLVLRVTGFPRISNTQRSDAASRPDAHHHESRHLYLGFQHPWDRDLWRGWLKQVRISRVPARGASVAWLEAAEVLLRPPHVPYVCPSAPTRMPATLARRQTRAELRKGLGVES